MKSGGRPSRRRRARGSCIFHIFNRAAAAGADLRRLLPADGLRMGARRQGARRRPTRRRRHPPADISGGDGGRGHGRGTDHRADNRAGDRARDRADNRANDRRHKGAGQAETPAPDDASAALFVLHHDGAVTRVVFGARAINLTPRGTGPRASGTPRRGPVGEPMKSRVVVYAAAFDPKGERVVTAQRDKTAQIWDAKTGEPIGKPMSTMTSSTRRRSILPAQRIVTASEDKTARIWDANTREPIGKPMQHGGGGVNSAAFDPTGERIVTASADKTARLWDVENRRADRQADAA